MLTRDDLYRLIDAIPDDQLDTAAASLAVTGYADAGTRVHIRLGTVFATGILTEYIRAAMAQAKYESLGVEGFRGEIPRLQGLWGQGKTHQACLLDLQAALEGWIVIRLVSGIPVPAIEGVELPLDPVMHAAVNAPLDDEPETDEERALIGQARAEAERAGYISHDEVKRRHGIR